MEAPGTPPFSLSEIFNTPLSQSRRLLTLEIAGAPLMPHRLVGEQRVNAPFRYTLDCFSQQGDIELKTLMAQPARLSVLQADGGYRHLHGVVSEAAMLGEDGGVTYYQLTLVPWLEMLKLGRDSRIFQDRSVVDVLSEVFEGHDLARGRLPLRPAPGVSRPQLLRAVPGERLPLRQPPDGRRRPVVLLRALG